MYKSYKVLFLLLFTLFFASGSFAQTCMLVSAEWDPAPQDVILKDWLESQGYEVATIASDDDINTEFYTDEEIAAHDFIFISESVGSGNIAPLKGAPIPMVNLELWGSKWDVMGWVPANTSGLYYENSTEGTIRILDGDHPLAAGYATDDEVEIVASTTGTSWTCYSNPQIDFIPVAELVSSTAENPQINVFGVEAGTWLYQAAETDPDGSVISENRVAGVGISVEGSDGLTDAGFEILGAAVAWVLNLGTAIENEQLASPVTYELNQNYPNPFNPSTQISFTLKQNGHTTLKVYDALGKEVATLMDAMASQGTHIVNFDAANLNSGVYFYQLVSGDYKETRKMMLIE